MNIKTWELVNWCEFDKYASKSYCAIHNVSEELNLGDITKVDEKELDDFNMMAGGSPCQDFSVAGKQEGAKWTCEDCGHKYNPLEAHYSTRDKCPKCNSVNIEKTRSSLLVEWLRILREKKPNFALYENVKNIVGKQFKYTFELFIKELNDYGYNTYWKVLNAKHYGIPQNRERVYLIIIKKDLDNGRFKYPEPFDNGIRLKDILDTEVDEKFYISDDKVNKFISELNFKNSRDYKNSITANVKVVGALNSSQDGIVVSSDGVSPTHTAGHGNCPKIIEENKVQQIGNIVETGNWGNPQRGRIYSSDGCSPALNCCGGGGLEPKILQTVCEQIYDEGMRFFKDNICGSLRTIDSCGDKRIIENKNNNDEFRIRKLTPKECFRLMGFADEDFHKAEEVVSNSQLYKQAGNSIVVDVLFYILVELYKAMPYLFDDIKLSSFFSGIGAFEKALDKLFQCINDCTIENFTKPQEV